jgi:hypothetical protein
MKGANMNIQRNNLWVLAVAFTVLFNFGCSDEQAAAPNGKVGAQEDEDGTHWKVTDEHCDEALAKNNKGEAREWLKDATHIFFKGDKKQIAQFIEDFYSAGAEQVYIADTETHNGSVYGGSLLVVLPQYAGARAKIFDLDKKVSQAFDEDAVQDRGQKYLFHAFD